VVDLVRFRGVVGVPAVALALRRFPDLGGDEAHLRRLAVRHRATRGLVFPTGLPELVPPFFRAR
jgi:hypothetical protein